MSEFEHRPVLLEEAVEALNIKGAIRRSGIYLDGTFGRGGHSRAILDRLSEQGSLFSLDRDPEALAAGMALKDKEPRFSIVQGNYADMDRLVPAWSRKTGLDGILLDLGVSSPQLDDPERGFSFKGNGPLDMRMNPLRGVSAGEWLNDASEKEISRVLWEFGEERKARRIARSIVLAREQRRLETTGQLAQLIEDTVGRQQTRKHPATQCFQAIRIFINNEIADLARGLQAAISGLRPGGRLVVISFHSLEDRLVKRTLKEAARPGQVRRNIPEHPDVQPVMKLIGKLIRPSESETSVNPRARSAVMRVAEKLS